MASNLSRQRSFKKSEIMDDDRSMMLSTFQLPCGFLTTAWRNLLFKNYSLVVICVQPDTVVPDRINTLCENWESFCFYEQSYSLKNSSFRKLIGWIEFWKNVSEKMTADFWFLPVVAGRGVIIVLLKGENSIVYFFFVFEWEAWYSWHFLDL